MAASVRPPYLPLIQKPTCCAVTCLQMILFRNGFGLFDQEELAIKFGVKIRPDMALAFRSTMPVLTRDNFDEGIATVEAEEQINAFFADVAPALKAKVFKHSAIASLADFLTLHLMANHDIWIEYHAHEIHAADAFKGNYIHDGLIESLKNDGTVTLIDPKPEHRQRLFIDVSVLDKAISTFYGRETGFVVIER